MITFPLKLVFFLTGDAHAVGGVLGGVGGSCEGSISAGRTTPDTRDGRDSQQLLSQGGKCGSLQLIRARLLVPPSRDAPRPLDLERLGAKRLAPLHQRLAHGPNLGALALAQGEGEVGGGSREP